MSPFRSRQVALVEQQVDHREDLRQPGAQLITRGNPIRNIGLHDLLFRARNPLGHSCFGDQKCPGDLGRRQAADDP